MTKNQKILDLYLLHEGFVGRNASKISKTANVDRKSISYLRTIMTNCTTTQQTLVKEAIQLGEKIKFSNGEITGSLEVCAALVKEGHVVEGYGDMHMVVYLLECDSKIKIGISKSISSRIAMMQTGNPYKITLRAEYKVASETEARRLEKELHIKYNDKQLIGEWFDLTQEELADVNEYLQEAVAT